MLNHREVWVVVPALDEERAIAAVITSLLALELRVVVVDDGSRDATAAAAAAAGARVVRHPLNLGQGAALRTGIDYALARGAAAVVTFDADGQHDAADVPALLAALEHADVALGSRFLGGVATPGASRARRGFLRASVLVSNLLARQRLSDSHCGLRALSAGAARKLALQQSGMAHASELLALLRRHRLRVREVPVTVRYTAYSKAKGQRPIAAVRVLFDLLVQPLGARP